MCPRKPINSRSADGTTTPARRDRSIVRSIACDTRDGYAPHAMKKQVIALSLRTAARLPSIPDIQRQVKEGRLDAEPRLAIIDLEAMKHAYAFAIVTTHERWEVMEVLDALGLCPYIPAEHLVVSPKGKRQDLEHWRRWRARFAEAGTPLSAVIDNSEKGPGSVLWPLSNARDFDDVNLYYWPHAEVVNMQPMPGAIRIDRLSDTKEYWLATQA